MNEQNHEQRIAELEKQLKATAENILYIVEALRNTCDIDNHLTDAILCIQSDSLASLRLSVQDPLLPDEQKQGLLKRIARLETTGEALENKMARLKEKFQKGGTPPPGS